MEKQFPLVLNITKPIDPQNHIRFFRGDNVQFIFSYTDGAGNVPSIISEAVKLRVYAKKIYADGVKKEELPIFSGEFDDKEVVSFSSLQTAGDAGNYLMAVILLDASGNVITAQGIYLDLLENGYAGVYQPSPDFRDEVLDALAQAQAAAANAAASATSAQASLADCNSAKTAAQSSATSAESSAQSAEASAAIAVQQASDAESAKDAAVVAKNTATTQAGLASDSATNAAQSATTAQQAAAQAVEITDPEGWRTDTRAMIARLALEKSDSGTLYCNGGYAKTNSAGFTSLSKATMLIRFARKGAPTSLETLCALGDGGTQQTGFLVRISSEARFSVLCYFRKADGTGSDGPHASVPDISEYLDGKMHAFALCWSGKQTRIFIDGKLKGLSAFSDAGMTVQGSSLGISFGARALTNKEYFYGQVSDFAVLNYDASEVDSNGNYTSAYSIADYQAGKRLPPALCSTTATQRAIVSLENYTIARNVTTKLIKDASGNGNDATVSGDVAGDMDAGIAAFVDELKTQISQQS